MKVKNLKNLVKEYFSSEKILHHYKKAITEVGLWESEKIIFKKYLKKKDRILDIGCGTGRVTFGLYDKGYHRIEGLDLSESMLQKALEHAKVYGYGIKFYHGDAGDLNFEDFSFDSAIFSFNGLMLIPGRENRLKTMIEIRRILKPGGIFIFTTHDRYKTDEFQSYWIEEEDKWEKGIQHPGLIDFGDRIVEVIGEKGYVHIASYDDIKNLINESGFKYLEDAWQADICEEPEAVKQFAYGCRFWVVRKTL